MSVTTSLWWPEDRIKATLSSEHVFSQLPSNILHRLVEPLPWGEGLTSETYLDWILSKAGRLFLILVDIGIPDRIFALVDESFDDSDLPIAAHSVDRLHLSPDIEDTSLESKFFLAQWRFIVRGIGEGEHVKYTENEGVPVELLRTGTALVREGVEKVVLASAVCRVYLRTQVTIGGAPHFFEEDEVLEEIKSLRRLAHDHVYSIYGSYFVDKTVCILFTGVYERTLMSFLTDIPQHFKRLPKAQRREILLNWPHCLANGLSWLHAHGQVHGAIRPSNILVDADYRVFLGQFEALDMLLPPVKVDDVESYQYGAPERWVRSASVQQAGPQRIDLPSGGRTARKQPAHPMKLNLSLLKGSHRTEHESVSPRSESMVSQSTAIRVGFPGSRFSFAASSSSSGSSIGSARKRVISSIKRPILYTPSITSSSSSGSSSNRASIMTNPVGLLGTNSSAAVVHTWESHQTDPEASDIFSLGAVTLNIFTHLCKRKISAFAHHRGAKNRTAGRGGGVADCSFHLDRNLTQVTSWITLLDHDSKKQKDPVFQAVRPMLAVVRDMLNKEPADRPSAYQVEHHFFVAIHQVSGVANMHCSSHLQPHTRRSKNQLHEAPHATTPRLTVPSISRSASPHSPLTVATNSPIYEEESIGFTPSSSPSVAGFNLSSSMATYAENSDTDQDSSGYAGSDTAPWYDPSWSYRMAV
ncbi:hypothetical protein BDV41DRAFT_377954 [Aspergillus transmontanensis]|uniref:Protein kinase domain-containing protein n=1 Tax=Aspergillus transmontanensis TaxID=1034304 RepID=A0A5N6WC61_9EURO|nr:hypothetical protein BDV41DRAFT_377954 [Aspergillus transmontanensis]